MVARVDRARDKVRQILAVGLVEIEQNVRLPQQPLPPSLLVRCALEEAAGVVGGVTGRTHQLGCVDHVETRIDLPDALDVLRFEVTGDENAVIRSWRHGRWCEGWLMLSPGARNV